jgi:hypothetical protein
MGGCFTSGNATDETLSKKDKKPSEIGYQKPAVDRVDETDKAILDLKGRMRKVNTYITKLET